MKAELISENKNDYLCFPASERKLYNLRYGVDVKIATYNHLLSLFIFLLWPDSGGLIPLKKIETKIKRKLNATS